MGVVLVLVSVQLSFAQGGANDPSAEPKASETAASQEAPAGIVHLEEAKNSSHVAPATLEAETADSSPPKAANSSRRHPREFSSDFWTTGGMVPFVYIPAVATVGLEFAGSRSTPLFFSDTAGGAENMKDKQLSFSWVVGSTVGVAGLFAAIPSDARWYHVKGMSQAVLTTGMLTNLAKWTFSRHRPDWQPGETGDQRKSFFSGHSSITLATTTYATLYLSGHLFRQTSGAGARVAEGVTYAALLAASIYVPWERVHHNRHHLSDVLTGSAVGIASSTIFYFWQQRRYQRALARFEASQAPAVVVLPMVDSDTAGVILTWSR